MIDVANMIQRITFRTSLPSNAKVGTSMTRAIILVCAFAVLACQADPGANLNAELAQTAVVEMKQALTAAQEQYQEGSRFNARKKLKNAIKTYNTKLQSGVTYHCSSTQALRLSYLLGNIGREFERSKGQPDIATKDLLHELDSALATIPVQQPQEVAAR